MVVAFFAIAFHFLIVTLVSERIMSMSKFKELLVLVLICFAWLNLVGSANFEDEGRAGAISDSQMSSYSEIYSMDGSCEPMSSMKHMFWLMPFIAIFVGGLCVFSLYQKGPPNSADSDSEAALIANAPNRTAETRIDNQEEKSRKGRRKQSNQTIPTGQEEAREGCDGQEQSDEDNVSPVAGAIKSSQMYSGLKKGKKKPDNARTASRQDEDIESQRGKSGPQTLTFMPRTLGRNSDDWAGQGHKQAKSDNAGPASSNKQGSSFNTQGSSFNSSEYGLHTKMAEGGPVRRKHRSPKKK